MNSVGNQLKNKLLIISAVNFDHGGPLKILKDCAESAVNDLSKKWKIIVIVHDKNLVLSDQIHAINIPWAKNSWINRLYVEWVVFKKISVKFKPDLWISLHDITPNVIAKRRVVYCHNPAPFYYPSVNDILFDWKFIVFVLLYKYVYKFRIKDNYAVIVQQNWIKNKLFKLTGHINIIVSRPSLELSSKVHYDKKSYQDHKTKFIFFYPAFPRVFKNFEVVCEAFKKLPDIVRDKCELRITINGKENAYAKYLYSKYKDTCGIKFLGALNLTDMSIQYAESSALLFPSKLETWGLPISEAKQVGLPMLIADLPYARETAGDYDKVEFIDPVNANQWSNKMSEVTSINYVWGVSKQMNDRKVVNTWAELLYKLTYDL
jgi:glycosyltransferase involved in cell wall biosynthesis